MKKFLSLPLFALALSSPLSAQTVQEAYIEKYAPVAVREMQRSGIPASITLAQGLLESGAGKSALAAKGNNHFGIKCHNNWTGKTMRVDDDAPKECFRVYSSAEESFRDHSDFLRYRDRYKFLFDLEPTDYKGWAYGLRKAGYATDPSYASKLIKYIETYRLYRFDSMSSGESVSVPESPRSMEEPKKVDSGPQSSEEYTFSLSRLMYSLNGVPFVYSTEGESYGSIADSYGLKLSRILKYNDLDAAASDPAPGSIVYLKAKKSRSAKGLDKYIVEEDGTDIREISQRFGVKLSSLLKRNKLAGGYVLREGDEILLR